MKYCCHRGLSSPSWRFERGHVLRRGVGAEDGVGGIAREEVDQEEGRDRHEDDDDDEQHQPLDDVTGHGAPFPPSSVSIPFPRAGLPRRRMILDLRPLVLPCGPCLRRFPLSRGRTRTVVGIAVGLVVAAGLLLRFWTRSGLWLDEALTVNIARLPLHDIPDALKHDGAPPLYYYLLHFWIVLFGQSNDAVRALSGIFAVVTLPVAWLCGRRLGGRAVAWTMLVLLASAPFAVYYATESRMYALVILLTGCGYLALARAVDQPASRQPRRRRRRDGGAALHAVLVDLPRRHGRHLAGRLRRAHPPARAARRTPRGPPSSRVAAGCLLFVPWAADVRLPVRAHRHAVGGAAQLLRRDQRPHGLHRQPGFHVADGHEPGPAAGGHLLRHAGAGRVRHRPVRPHHRAGPAHPPACPQPRLRGARHAVRRHRRRDPHRQRVLLALRRGGLPALRPPRGAGDDDTAQSAGPGRRSSGWPSWPG